MIASSLSPCVTRICENRLHREEPLSSHAEFALLEALWVDLLASGYLSDPSKDWPEETLHEMSRRMAMSSEIYAAVQAGDLSVVYALAEELGEDGIGVMYQWLQVAAALGNTEAAAIADGVYEGVLQQAGDETVACLHLAVGEWFILGDRGVARDPGLGLDQLACAEQFGLTQSVDVDGPLRALQAALTGEALQRFHEIFPGLSSG